MLNVTIDEEEDEEKEEVAFQPQMVASATQLPSGGERNKRPLLQTQTFERQILKNLIDFDKLDIFVWYPATMLITYITDKLCLHMVNCNEKPCL